MEAKAKVVEMVIAMVVMGDLYFTRSKMLRPAGL